MGLCRSKPGDSARRPVEEDHVDPVEEQTERWTGRRDRHSTDSRFIVVTSRTQSFVWTGVPSKKKPHGIFNREALILHRLTRINFYNGKI